MHEDARKVIPLIAALGGGGGGGGAVDDVKVSGTSVVTDGVANVPKASGSTLGVVAVGEGLTIGATGILYTERTTLAEEKTGTNQYKVVVPSNQHGAAFYGLAKAAGDSTQSASANDVGTYTETAKSKISDMLNAPETVTGSTPSITAKSGIKYVCGEVSTISITPPASGDCEVVFESGSTAAVLTVPNTVKWPSWFDPDNLDADTTYDIIISDAEYGMVALWT